MRRSRWQHLVVSSEPAQAPKSVYWSCPLLHLVTRRMRAGADFVLRTEGRTPSAGAHTTNPLAGISSIKGLSSRNLRQARAVEGGRAEAALPQAVQKSGRKLTNVIGTRGGSTGESLGTVLFGAFSIIPRSAHPPI